ncbi:MAG TPA: alpha/beta hydrolase [Deltaproteobacteria bacterium]|nr:alpha/beta hydrolase [Deltaproteobacteria bacterium]
MLKYFSIDSMKIACWVNGNGFDEQAQSLFFIHGSGGDHSSWSFQYARLNKNFNIIAVDLPGHGSSEGSGENDINKYSLWVKKLLDALQLKNVIIVGHSLGAAIALTFAAEFGSMIKGIAAVGGGLKMPVNPAIFELLKKEPETAFELMCKFSLAKENRDKLAEPLKKSMAVANIEALYNDLVACDKMDLTEKVKIINLPSMIMCGEEDKMTPPQLSRDIAASIKGSKTCFIKNAGHMVMMENPEEFNKALIDFAKTIAAQKA